MRLFLQLPACLLESIVDGKSKTGEPLIALQNARHANLFTGRHRQMDPDGEGPASTLRARRGDHDPAPDHPAEPPFDRRNLPPDAACVGIVSAQQNSAAQQAASPFLRCFDDAYSTTKEIFALIR